DERRLLCVDRGTGKVKWTRTVLESPLEGKHRRNSFASSTPATDGERVYVSFLDGDKMFVAAYDFAGKKLWEVRPGVFSSIHGYCSSPVLWKGKVIVNGDHDGDSYIVALDRTNGKTIWKEMRPNRTRSYCTPIIRTIEGRNQLIFSGDKAVTSLDPDTGELHWVLDGPTEQFVASLVYNGDLLFMTCGF
ncbi:MAG: PQQ-like beta-propeller repeat protein, partial [Akkermansiaceae bacterium]|nr:PQQ-like beta-propeller repeat protein [Akkermansiaceae bacterium]